MAERARAMAGCVLRATRARAGVAACDGAPGTGSAERTMSHAEVGRRAYDCVFLRPGRVQRADGSPSEWLIPCEVVRRAAHRFDGLSVYLDHPEVCGAWGERQAPSVRDLAGVTGDAHWSEAEGALVGTIRLYDQDPHGAGAYIGGLIDQILDDRAAGRHTPPIGLSAVFYHEAERDEGSGLYVTTEIVHAQSVDFVYAPGAGGIVRAALSAANYGATSPTPLATGEGTHKGGTDMTDNEILTREEQPAGEGAGHEVPLTFTAEPDDLAAQVTALTVQVNRLQAALAAREEPETIQDMGTPPRSPVRGTPLLSGGMLTGVDQVTAALDAMLAGARPPDGIRPLTGIRELYTLLSGDYEMTGVFRPERVYLANVTTATMAGLVANALNKRVINLFAQYPQWWAPAVTVQDFATLQDVRWITLGGPPRSSRREATWGSRWRPSTRTTHAASAPRPRSWRRPPGSLWARPSPPSLPPTRAPGPRCPTATTCSTPPITATSGPPRSHRPRGRQPRSQ